jgi:hypothetical protein
MNMTSLWKGTLTGGSSVRNIRYDDRQDAVKIAETGVIEILRVPRFGMKKDVMDLDSPSTSAGSDIEHGDREKDPFLVEDSPMSAERTSYTSLESTPLGESTDEVSQRIHDFCKDTCSTSAMPCDEDLELFLWAQHTVEKEKDDAKSGSAEGAAGILEVPLERECLTFAGCGNREDQKDAATMCMHTSSVESPVRLLNQVGTSEGMSHASDSPPSEWDIGDSEIFGFEDIFGVASDSVPNQPPKHHGSQTCTSDADAHTGSIHAWLEASALGRYAAALEEAGYDDLRILQEIDDEEVDEIISSLNMPRGHARHLKRGVDKLRHARAACMVQEPLSARCDMSEKDVPKIGWIIRM